MILFGIGRHPAFYIDLKQNNYLEFENKEENINFLQLQDGMISAENNFIKSRLEDNKIIKINKDTFKKDAIIMENIKSNIIQLFETIKKY